MKPTVVWITGLSGAGKTTTAQLLHHYCYYKGHKVALLDSDEVRKKLEESKQRVYGFSLDERKQFISNVVYMARNMIEFQKTEIVIVSTISPLKEIRDNARHILTNYSGANFIEVFMDTSLETCEQRDPKGLYKKARAGEIKEFTGIDSPYERPTNPEVIIHERTTLHGKMTVDRAVKMIYNRIYEL